MVAGISDPWYRLVTSLTACCIDSTYAFHRSSNFMPVLMPVTTGAVSSPIGRGSDSVPVAVSLHGQPTYLADSMQFQLEYLLRQGHPGVFYVMPTFRGEDPDSSHLNEFFHVEAELVGGFDDVVDHVDRFVRHVARDVCASSLVESLASVAGGIEHVERLAGLEAIPRMTFDDAVDELRGSPDGVVHDELGPLVITRAGERTLLERAGGAVWLTHPPERSVPFYQASDPDGRARSADLLLGIGEVVGCGERHADGPAVLRSLTSHGVAPDDYRWYVMLKDKYPLRTAGFGLGLERLLLWLMRHDDIRDIPVMPRLRTVPYAF